MRPATYFSLEEGMFNSAYVFFCTKYVDGVFYCHAHRQ